MDYLFQFYNVSISEYPEWGLVLARSPCHDACEWVTLKQCFPGGRGNTDTTHHHQQQTASLLSAGKQPAVISLTDTTLWLLNISSGVTAVEFDTTLPSGGRLLRSREAEGIRAMVAGEAAAQLTKFFPGWRVVGGGTRLMISRRTEWKQCDAASIIQRTDTGSSFSFSDWTENLFPLPCRDCVRCISLHRVAKAAC